MKPKQFALCLEAYAKAFGAVGATASEQRLLNLAKVFKGLKIDTIETVVSAVGRAGAASSTAAQRGSLQDFAADMNAVSLATAKTATKSTREAVNSVARLLADHSTMSFESFIQKLKGSSGSAPSVSAWQPLLKSGETKVDAYARALDDAVHDPKAFPAIFEAFRNDPDIKKAEVVQVANRIVFKMPAKTTRDEALAQILKRHQVSEGAASKVRSIGGKSAA